MTAAAPAPASGSPGEAAGPLSILVAALGGEGGGVLADWLVRCGIRSGLPIQATSVPGVAQRTGSTSYYLELMPQPLPPGAPRPVFALNPVPGRVDVLVASEAVEAGRMIERGFVRPDRTILIASTHRVYTTAEKMHMADGRYDTRRVVGAGRRMARQAVFLDMEATAARHGTVLSAVMFGALSGAGALPWSRETCEAVIRESGRGVAASLAGFDDAWRQAAAAIGPASLPELAEELRPAPDALRVLQTAGLPDARFNDWSKAIGALPLPMQASAAHGVLRCRDYQDDAYAATYLERLAALARAAGEPVAAGSAAGEALDEAARHLALWMCYEDVIRVADLKSRASRFERVREEARAAPSDVVRVVDYMKPGLDEVAAILPRRWGERLVRKAAAGGWITRLQPSLQVRSSSLWGHLLLRTLARLRPMRRASLRFAEEEDAIDAWLAALREALPQAPEYARALAGLPQVLKGYGDTHRRGRHNYARLWAAHVAPIVGAAAAPDFAAAARQLSEGLAATLNDPEGRLNQAAATVPRAEPEVRPIQWVRRPGGQA
jgi:indolepyruvate ferredoxin oxidoreductase beta subunit